MSVEVETIRRLSRLATLLRLEMLDTIVAANVGHIGGGCSAADIVTALYFHEMRLCRENPFSADRDRMIGKGHIPELQLCAAHLAGLLSRDGKERYCRKDSFIVGQAVPGVEFPYGSLGQTLSFAVGAAIGLGRRGSPARVYAVTGDGEIQEGQIWEAAMAAAHYRVHNLVWIIDNNGLQIGGEVKDVMNIYPIARKIRAFGWNVIFVDGHEFCEILESLAAARAEKRYPTAIVAKTVKGKGISFLENQPESHSLVPDRVSYDRARSELLAALKAIEDGQEHLLYRSSETAIDP